MINQKNQKLTIFSVIPAIIVTFLLWFDFDVYFELFLGIILINIIYFYEKIFFKDYLPTWYIKLRKNLNLIVSASVFIIVIITVYY